MSKYIDADELKEILKDPPLYASLGGMTLNGVFMLIDNEAPTIDLVRCGECRYWIGVCTNEIWQSLTDDYLPQTNADDFCSYGVKCSEKPNKLKVSEKPTDSERSSE